MALAVVLQCIGCLGLALSRYEKFIEENKWRKYEETIGTIISRGFALTDLVKLANGMFGKMIMIQYSVNLFYTTFGIYFSTSVFNVYANKSGQVNEFLLIFCIANIAFLIARYSATTTSPMRPCDVFNMNAANFVSIGGIVLTYIIVLLQFKHSSGSGLNLNFGEIRSFMQNKTMDDLRAFLNNRTSAGGGGGLFPLLAHGRGRPRLRLADRFGLGASHT